MKFAPAPQLLSALTLLIALSTPALGSSSKPVALPKMSPNTPQGMEGGFWKVDENFDPILRLKNVLLNQSLKVIPALYFADGTRYELPLIELEPAGVAQVNIRIALQSVPASIQSHVSSYGMAGISYQWSWPAVIATIRNTDEISSLTITSSLRADARKVHVAPETSSAQVIRGQWWLPTANADGYVVLENTSLTPKQTSVSFSGHAGDSLTVQQVSLPSHATAVIRLSTIFAAARRTETKETAGGIEIRYTGPEHGVLVYTGIEDDAAGYSASPVTIEDHLDPDRPVHEVTLNAPGLLLGNADPAMLFPSGTYFKPYAYLHNVSAKPLHVSLSLVSPGEGETPLTHSLGQVILQPGQVSQLDFESQFGSSNPLPNGYGHLTATFQGHDGDLMMSTGSVDQSQNYVFEVTPSQQSDTASRTLCFWSVEGDNDSMITVWNYKPTAQDLILTLYYSGGHYKIPIHLAARQSYNLDMMSLVRSRTPDPDGTLIPSNITSGSGILTGPGGETDKISVALAASVFNVRNATCGESCTTCNGATEFALDPGSYTVAVAGTRAAQVQVTWNTGSVYTNPSGTNWATASSAIATVSSSGTLLGVAPGQTGVTANVEDYSMYSMNCSGDEQGGCPTGSPACGGPANVLPLLESSTPLWFFGPGNNPGASFTLGSTQSVITAVRASGGTFAWSIPDGSDELSFTSGSENYSTTTTSNTVTVYSIGYSVDANDVTIQLSWTPSGSSTAIGPISLDLTIDSPYELVSTGATTNRGVGTSCSTGSPNGTAGYQSLVPYQIVSFTGVVISNIGVNETFEDYTDDYIGNTWPTYVAGSTTSSTGTFADNICAIHPAPSTPISLPPHSPLSTVKIDHASQSWLIGSLTVGSGVEVQTNTLQRYQDHGVHNAITSPVR